MEDNNVRFNSGNSSFIFTVDNDGANPVVLDANLNSMEAFIAMVKETTRGAVVPLTGTFVTDAMSSSAIDGTWSLIFNSSNGQDNTVDITSQTIFNSRDFGSTTGIAQTNCVEDTDLTTCDIAGMYTSLGADITWSGTHLFRSTADCSQASGTWSTADGLSGTFITDSVCSNTTIETALPITPSPAGTGCDTPTFELDFTSTSGNTDSGLDPSCAFAGQDQFFTWTATTDQLYFHGDEGFPRIAIYDANENEIACHSLAAPTTINGWEIGDELIIQIFDIGSTVQVDISFCLEESTIPDPPVNDTIDGAIPITPSPIGSTCGADVAFELDFSAASGTTDSGLNPSCATAVLDQFFTWTATTDLLLFDDANGAARIAIYDANENEITCANVTSEVILDGWAIGDDLIIQIFNLDASDEIVRFCLFEHEEATAPVNDTIDGAIPLPFAPSPPGTACDDSAFDANFSLDFTDESGTTTSGLASSCVTNPGRDQFFTWTATTDELIYDGASPGFPRFVIYDANQNEIACVGGSAATTVGGWNVGDTLILQFVDVNSGNQDLNVFFCLTEG